MPPITTGTSKPGVGQCADDTGGQGKVAGVVHRDADHVGVLLLDGSDDGVGGLAQT